MRGFTLIEMIITILLLSIVGLFLGNVIQQGMGIYVDSTAREALIQQGKFVTERMTRELREAVPNSILIENDCIEFLPIINSAIYQELPAPEAKSAVIRILPIDKSIYQGERVIVYPNDPNSMRLDPAIEGQIAEVKEDVDFTTSAAVMVNVELTQATGFETSSPSKRLYFYLAPVAYCHVNARIFRYADYPLSRMSLSPESLGNGVLIAENVKDAAFQNLAPELERNGLVRFELLFADKGEEIQFVHDALIYNAP
ncbi:PilW family protein [Vibrio cyclitrophicus]|uniref:PilW family protein n=1 Tax=Vibrio cyclitrophicus TaxID=47951 RepID=UPI000C82EF7E|nr:prepilin-type N-terminal cleavage/methylation domain-containing protein [Vibrio cyclitrophicus]PME20402.1 MSHA biogenesis protein MshO [Vibrio cyclitrophicus]PME67713.1 MSHA biogenesis protein MshO [Vibrio cyclitrophicus]PMK19481.1 MSHA biogenesis protein MshO [Vibrio cyclitrophicus]